MRSRGRFACRRAFLRLLRLLASAGVLDVANPALRLCAAPQQQPQQPTQPPAQPPPPSPAPTNAVSTILQTISGHVNQVIQQLDQASTTIAHQTCIISTVMGGYVENSGVRMTASGGTVISFNFSTGAKPQPTTKQQPQRQQQRERAYLSEQTLASGHLMHSVGHRVWLQSRSLT